MPARKPFRSSTPKQSRCRSFDEINDDYRNANIDTIFYYAVFFPLVDFIGAVGIALIIWYGGYRVMQNTPGHTVLTLGALVAFIQYSSFLFQPIRDISDKYNVLQAAVVASHRIFKTLDLPIAITTPEKPLKSGRAAGHIEFENVWFAYKDEDWVLKDVSFTVEPGQSIALVGHTGSGKTTITNLLMRFYDVQRGRILLDGVDLRDWDLNRCGRTLRSCLQEIFLFSGTVEGNIRLGREDISEERVSGRRRKFSAEPFHRAFEGRLSGRSQGTRRGTFGGTETVDLVCARAGVRSGAADPRRSHQLDRHRNGATDSASHRARDARSHFDRRGPPAFNDSTRRSDHRAASRRDSRARNASGTAGPARTLLEALQTSVRRWRATGNVRCCNAKKKTAAAAVQRVAAASSE